MNTNKTEDRSMLKNALSHCTSTPKSLSDNRLQVLLNTFRKQVLHKDVVLLHQGNRFDKVYFVEQGIIRLFVTTHDGHEFNKNFFAEGHFLWPATPGTRLYPSLFSVATLERACIWVADFALFQKHLIAFKRWESFALIFTEALADQKFSREYEFLMLDAEERYVSLLQRDPQLVNRVPDYHLASYLGITNVTLSRIRSRCRF